MATDETPYLLFISKLIIGPLPSSTLLAFNSIVFNILISAASAVSRTARLTNISPVLESIHALKLDEGIH